MSRAAEKPILETLQQPLKLWENLRKQAETATCSSGFYHWILSKGEIPEQLALKPVDPWPGNADRGRSICNGMFVTESVSFPFYGDFWQATDDHALWHEQLHSFEWLRDLRAFGGDQARRMARHQVERWLHRYDRWHERAWRPDITGQRLAMWLVFYDFFCASADEDFQRAYFTSLIRQGKHLSRTLSDSYGGVAMLQAAKGLIYAGLAFPGREAWVIQGVETLMAELPRQILPDGGHISRSPQQLVTALQILLDLRCTLNRAHLPVPEGIQAAIERAAQGVRFFRYADRKLAIFNATQEGDVALMDALLSQAGAGKIVRSLPDTGFERVVQGRSMLMVDVGKSPVWPNDAHVHESPLAFEFAYGKERIFVNCGTHPAESDWRQALRFMPAHNTLSIDNRDILDIRPDGHTGRRLRKISVLRTENRDSCLVEGRHEGYVSQNGIIHRRRLYLCDQGHDLRGEETLSADLAPARETEVAIRFHIHPRVLVSLVQEGSEALLRLQGGAGWRFYISGGKLELDNSIYLGQGARPVKTKQLVIKTAMTKEVLQLKWALQREGI